MIPHRLLIVPFVVVLALGLCTGSLANPGESADPEVVGSAPAAEARIQDCPQKSSVRSLQGEELQGAVEARGEDGDGPQGSSRNRELIENIWCPLMDHLDIDVGPPLVEEIGAGQYALIVPVTAEIPGSVIDRVGMWADAQPDLATYSWNRFDGPSYGALRAYDGSPGGDDAFEIYGRNAANEGLFREAHLAFRLQIGDKVVERRPYQGDGEHDQITAENRFITSVRGFSKEELGQLERISVEAYLDLSTDAEGRSSQ
ncbi:hypothetical protein [Halorhodospira neutriphila]|uniref:Uncharacterized protein n=1 Tax=Halorhodospira neutriphila TaxID=168379 RepID=A0ABS1E6I9_9GAMM|nr:hypothetical protein [Halorhodospira neutriphila]MBK1726355.1 hypothetical protein [Halorhodospira neutriphila]